MIPCDVRCFLTSRGVYPDYILYWMFAAGAWWSWCVSGDNFFFVWWWQIFRACWFWVQLWGKYRFFMLVNACNINIGYVLCKVMINVGCWGECDELTEEKQEKNGDFVIKVCKSTRYKKYGDFFNESWWLKYTFHGKITQWCITCNVYPLAGWWKNVTRKVNNKTTSLTTCVTCWFQKCLSRWRGVSIAIYYVISHYCDDHVLLHGWCDLSFLSERCNCIDFFLLCFFWEHTSVLSVQLVGW